MAELKLEGFDLSLTGFGELLPDARTHSEAQVAQIAGSIREFRFTLGSRRGSGGGFNTKGGGGSSDPFGILNNKFPNPVGDPRLWRAAWGELQA